MRMMWISAAGRTLRRERGLEAAAQHDHGATGRLKQRQGFTEHGPADQHHSQRFEIGQGAERGDRQAAQGGHGAGDGQKSWYQSGSGQPQGVELFSL